MTEIKFIGAPPKDLKFPRNVRVKIKMILYYEPYPWNDEEEGDIIDDVLIRTYPNVLTFFI